MKALVAKTFQFITNLWEGYLAQSVTDLMYVYDLYGLVYSIIICRPIEDLERRVICWRMVVWLQSLMKTTSLIWMTRCKYVCVYIVPYTSYIWLEFYLLLVHLKTFSGHIYWQLVVVHNYHV